MVTRRRENVNYSFKLAAIKYNGSFSPFWLEQPLWTSKGGTVVNCQVQQFTQKYDSLFEGVMKCICFKILFHGFSERPDRAVWHKVWKKHNDSLWKGLPNLLLHTDWVMGTAVIIWHLLIKQTCGQTAHCCWEKRPSLHESQRGRYCSNILCGGLRLATLLTMK